MRRQCEPLCHQYGSSMSHGEGRCLITHLKECIFCRAALLQYCQQSVNLFLYTQNSGVELVFVRLLSVQECHHRVIMEEREYQRLEIHWKRCRESLTYLVHAYHSNLKLLKNGKNRGVDEALIAYYRRKCLLELNACAADLFESGNEKDVAEGLSIMNDLVIPCMHLIVTNELSKEDLAAVEMMRNHWCSYLGEDMDSRLQEQLTEFLPRLLDCSAEVRILREPPKIRPNSPHDLCNRFAAVMESIHNTSPVTVK